MKTYLINFSSSDESVKALQSVKETLGLEFYAAKINAKTFVTDSGDSREWPLILKCDSPLVDEVRIRCLTCGYGGSGPHDLIECLEIAGFKNLFTNSQIFNNKHVNMCLSK